MPSLDAMLAVALAGLTLSVTPGPSMLYVLSRTVGQSRAAGLASALGLCLGGIFLAVATALGLAAVV
jgi:threonine/homoserine/homoserine lactone efflux protein